MKIALAFCINLLIFNSAYAELSRKDRVSYTLDFYTGNTKERNVKIKQQLEKTMQQEEKISYTEYFSKTKPQKRLQAGNKQKKAASMEKAKTKKTIKEKIKVGKRTATVQSEEKKKYGTKLSFSKASDKPKEKNIPVSKKDGLKKEIKEKETTEVAAQNPNYLKGILKNTHPYIVEKTYFDDNIYHIKGNETYDCITKLYPGFEFKSRASQKKFNAYLNTGFEVLRYTKNHQHNHESPYAAGLIGYNLGKVGFITSASGKRLRGSASDLADSEIKQFIDAWHYEMSQDVKLGLNRLEVGLQYNKSLDGYEDEGFKSSNHTRDVVALRNSIKIFPKTKLFLEYAHGWINYHKDTSSNLDYDRTVVGVNGQILRKLDGTIKVGYSFNKRKTLKDLNGSVFNALLTYKASPRLHYHFNAVNGLGNINLVSENITKYKGVSLGASYLPPFLKKLRITSDVRYWQRGIDYQTKDNYLEVSFKPEYRFNEWLMLGLGYTFKDRTSKSQTSDYRNNVIELNVTSEF